MVIIVLVGGLFAGAAVFAALKNTSKARESKVTKLDISSEVLQLAGHRSPPKRMIPATTWVGRQA